MMQSFSFKAVLPSDTPVNGKYFAAMTGIYFYVLRMMNFIIILSNDTILAQQ